MDLNEIPGADSFARHPWEVERARFFADILEPLLAADGTRLLDAGSGDGWFARSLTARHAGLEVTCFDPGYAELGDGSLPASERVEYVASQPPGPFDVVTLLDVLEHVPDDLSMLGGLSAALRPGGSILVSVPAWPALFSRHDVALRHERRYRPRQLLGLLRRTGLVVERSGGLFHSLLVARGATVAAERLASRPPAAPDMDRHELQWRGGRISRQVVQSALRADTRVSEAAAARGVQLPGLSCWALCRRPS